MPYLWFLPGIAPQVFESPKQRIVFIKDYGSVEGTIIAIQYLINSDALSVIIKKLLSQLVIDYMRL